MCIANVVFLSLASHFGGISIIGAEGNWSFAAGSTVYKVFIVVFKCFFKNPVFA